MRIVCPSCESAYDVPAPILARHRTFRCVQCHADWMPEAAPPVQAFSAHGATGLAEPLPAPGFAPDFAPDFAPAAAVTASPAIVQTLPAIEADPDVEAVRRLWLPPEEPEDEDEGVSVRRAVPVLAAWVLSLALLGAAGWAMVAWRAEVMQAWPPSARLYMALGYVS